MSNIENIVLVYNVQDCWLCIEHVDQFSPNVKQ